MTHGTVMHDIRFIRDNPEAFDRGLARRGLPPQAQRLIALDETRRAAIQKAEGAQARRNAASKEIGEAKKEQRRSQGQRPDGRGRGAEGFNSADGGGGEVGIQSAERCARRNSQICRSCTKCPTARTRKDNVEHHRFRGKARTYVVRAEAAFRTRRSARPDGFRGCGEAVRCALCRFEERPRAAGTRARAILSRCAHEQATATPKSRRRYSCVTR